MSRLVILLGFICLQSLSVKAQEKHWYTPTKIGFMYGYGDQGSALLNDKDYSYSVNTVKVQLYYPLRKGKFDLDLIVEPTMGFAKHQLLNFYFIEPDQVDYLAKRAEFTQSKLLTEYILTASLILRHKIYKSNSIYIIAGFGPMIISKRTERLAKGFAFSDTIGMGFTAKISKNTYFDVRTRLRHLSNAELQHPNSGINIATLEAGFSFKL